MTTYGDDVFNIFIKKSNNLETLSFILTNLWIFYALND